MESPKKFLAGIGLILGIPSTLVGFINGLESGVIMFAILCGLALGVYLIADGIGKQ